MNSVTKSDIDKDFGQTIKKFRVNAGLTQEQLSEKLGISLKYISRLENGYSGIKTQTLIRCMNILGIEPNILFSKFITNKDIKDNIQLSEDIATLSEDYKFLASSIVDLLKNNKSK
jgi:transcriptional regulator with XRE-family HTH domain